MITPRRTRLVRVADLHAWRRIVSALSPGDSAEPADRLRPPTLVIVPTRGAARQLTRTILQTAEPSVRARVVPGFVTRDDLYDRLAERLHDRPRRLSPFEREAIVRVAAARTSEEGLSPPFQLRPRLIAEIVRFYDQLRRQNQSVDRFEEILLESLAADVELDRGAAQLVRQTRFLAAVFRIYEQRLRESGAVDEHALREHLLSAPAGDPVRHIVVTVADWIADVDGLYRADFDLLTRLPALESIDVVCTQELLSSGFHQRLHEWLPGIEEVDDATAERKLPVLVVPGDPQGPASFVRRDREEELVAIARAVKRDAASIDRVGVVFNRPLPYLYLAPPVFGGAGIPYESSDALPLATEPFAAALDVLLEFVGTSFTRAPLVALLRSPHFRLSNDAAISFDEVAAADRVLRDARYLGEMERLRVVADACDADSPARRALNAATDAARLLEPLRAPAPASEHIARLRTFFAAHASPPENDREGRAQSGILAIVDALGAAYRSEDDRTATIDEVAADLRRWIEEGTFAVETGEGGLRLVDARAARYGDFDRLFVVGLIEGEWPARPTRNVFYPPGQLAALGWPSERDRRAAETAAFIDLLQSAGQQTVMSTFLLDDDALVEPSFLIDEASRARLTAVPADGPADDRIFTEEALSLEPLVTAGLDEIARQWVDLRASRSPDSDDRFHGQAGARPPRALSVSSVEVYLSCPFKFFAQHVLRLDEERDDEDVMDPRRQGQFVHEVFEAFFSSWQERGHRAITTANLDDAFAMFAEIVDEHVERLPAAEAALERTRLLGSAVAPGLADVVFRMEAERSTDVVERLLEYELRGEFDLACAGGSRRVALRGIADRLDLLADGTVRLIDYKLSSAPQRSRALQLPIYAVCSEKQLAGRHGRTWKVTDAAYIAFRGAKRIVPLFTARADRDQVLRDAQEKLATAVDAIEAGRFPPTPTDVFICGFCSFASVCRKDYVGDV